MIMKEANSSISIHRLLSRSVNTVTPYFKLFYFAYIDEADKQPLCISSYLILSKNLYMTQLKSIEGHN